MSAAPAERPRFGAALAAVVLVGIVIYVVGRTAELFLLLFFAILLALYLSAIADFAVRRARFPRWLALSGAVLFTIGVIALFFVVILPPVAQQLQLLSATLPGAIQNLEQGLDALTARIPGLAQLYPPGEHRATLAIGAQLGDLVRTGFARLYDYAPRVLAAASAAVMAIYLAADPQRYLDAAAFFVPPRERAFVRGLVDDLTVTMRAWIIGQFINMVILGVMMAVGLKLLGVPYWLAFGMLTFALALVPFFGSIAATIIPALVVLGGEGDLGRALAVLALGLFVHLFEGNVLAPLVMAVQVDLPPVVTMFGILLFGWLLGPLGVLLAVPIMAAMHVVLQRTITERLYRTDTFRVPLPPETPTPPAPSPS